MLIDWNIHVPLDPAIQQKMQEAGDQSLLSEGIELPCSVSVTLCDNAMIEAINRQYRGIARETDVLSFPTVSYLPGKTAGSSPDRLRREYDDDSGTVFLGDLFISVPKAREQAAEYGHSVLREAVYLLVHGICHLMGYDHMEESDKENMRRMEEKILSSLSVSRETPDRMDDEMLMNLAREAQARSYSPYSRYPVGAALLAADGKVFLGCNIENASFGLTNCAERTAVFKAVSEGSTAFDTIAIAANTPAWPCGACRQVLNEFAPEIRVIITWPGHSAQKRLSELLPEGFGPHSMETKSETGDVQP